MWGVGAKFQTVSFLLESSGFTETNGVYLFSLDKRAYSFSKEPETSISVKILAAMLSDT